jgi:predicted dehydrogenase
MTTSTVSRRAVLLSTAAAAATAAQTTAPVRVAFVGTGHRTWAHIPVLKRIPGYQIVALADPTPGFRDKAATLVGSQPALYSDYRKMLAERTDIDAVVVVTPGSLHAEVVVAALGRGLHVLCEKPMTTSIEDANRMIAAQKKAGKILQIGHQLRFRGVTSKMAELVRGGQIGDVKFVTAYLHRGDWNPASWKAPDPKTGAPTVWRFLRQYMGTSLLEDGVHQLDILQWVIHSPVKRIYASGGNAVFQNRETIDHAAVTVEYASGTLLHFGFCLLAGGVRKEETLIGGTIGHLSTENGKITLRNHAAGKTQTFDTSMRAQMPAGEANPAAVTEIGAEEAQFHAFLNSVRTGAPPLVDAEAGKNAILIPIMAQKSIDERRPMERAEFPA